MIYLVDTNVVSEFRKIKVGKAHANVVDWAASVRATDLFLSAVTVFELELGTLLIERRDARQGNVLRSWLDYQVSVTFAGRILPVDMAIAKRSASLHVPDPRPDRDSLIAATALVHGMPVVTRNVSDFMPMGVSVINPWEP